MDWDDIYKDEGEVQQEPLGFVETFSEYLSPKDDVLDLGCGTGRHTLFLRNKGCRVTAYDKSEEALNILKSKYEGSRITPVLGDFEELPFDTSSFDAVLSTKALHHGTSETIETYIDEIDRVLTSPGTLGLSTLSINDHRSTTGTPYQGENNTRINCDDLPDSDIPHHFFTKDELSKMFSDYTTCYHEEKERVAMEGLSPSTYHDIILEK